jgi:hypothetical protein
MPDEKEELSSLERVRQRLYDPHQAASFEEPHLREQPVERARGWEKLKAVGHEAEHISGHARFFIVALLFFIVTAGGAVFYLIWGGRSISTHNVNIAVQGPTTIASGDTVPLLVTIENRNPVAIQGATVTIDFPDGTRSPDDTTKPMPRYTENLGDIGSGNKTERTVRAVVFGSEGQHVTLPIKVEYHTDGSTATFVKNKQYDFTITTSPITVNVETISQVSAGQPVTVDVSIKSNATTKLDNVAVLAEYPFGFAPTASTPQPSQGTMFVLGTLSPGEEKKIRVTGILSGENNDERTFKFSAGTVSSPESLALATPFTSKEASIRLTKPFLATTLSVNRDTTDKPVIDAGVPVQVVVMWTNTLPVPVTNAKVSVALSGEALDPAGVGQGNGFYRSSDTTVVFDSTTNPALAQLQPGDSGQGTFTIRSKSSSALATMRSASIGLRVSVSGQRLSETNVPETISSTLSRTVKVGTNLALASKVVHTVGPFKNGGPWPPEANSETTYTVIFTLSNSGNSVSGAKVSAALPSYVRFTGATNPSDGSITYNETTRTITWSAGTVATGSGSAKSAAFQIGFTPSVTQRGGSAVLVNAQQVTGVDAFTDKQIAGSVQALTTITSADPAYSAADGSVK